jgi:D-alanyl-D-alanine dipeptidase
MSVVPMEQLPRYLGRSKISSSALSITLFTLSLSFFAAPDFAQVAPFAFPGHKPADILRTWRPLIGEYGPEQGSFTVLEKSGQLVLRKNDGTEVSLHRAAGGTFTLNKPPGAPLPVYFGGEVNGQAASISLGDVTFPRRMLGPEEGQSFRIQLTRPIDELRQEALAASPPHKDGQFRQPDLVDLTSLDSTLHLDIRYATANDFLGTPVYTQARAFLQRPAAEALLRALFRLKPLGYGLLIHDAYRPWYVTKIFWNATPPEGKIFVADPAQGSRHNRGCAVDLTLYELKTGKPAQMPGTYDEMSSRSFPDYPGGTSLQRWHRDLLRWAMESEGFTVYEHEWWHFDFKDWHEYPILNVPFEKLQFNEKQAR